MKIKSIYVNNFKSLVDFRIDLADFNCLVGLNGSGKSTFLQFVSFLSQLMVGNLDDWFVKRKWIKDDIVVHRDNKINREIQFEINFFLADKIGSRGECCWKSTFSVDSLCCVGETISIGLWTLKIVPDKQGTKKFVLINEEKKQETVSERITFHYQGSILTQLADKRVVDKFKKMIDFFRSIQSFDPLSPHFLKQKSTTAHRSIGLGGENLAAFLFNLKDEKRSQIVGKIKKIYPAFSFFRPRLLQDQTKTLEIDEQYYDGTITYTTPARGINDGLLRMIAMLAQLESDSPFLLFDEIENGMNSEVIGFLLSQLIESGKQIVVTTHSPMILNYLDDKTAIPGVHFFYKTPEGFTKTFPLLQIPSMKEKLEVMGPGEVFIDTDLVKLSHELAENPPTERKEK
jgi:predicted ATPase